MNDNILRGISLDTEKVESVTKNELVAFNQSYQMQLRQSPDVQQIIGSVDVTNSTEILNFGQTPAMEISKVADTILRSTTAADQQKISVIMSSLMKVMKKFDIKDFAEEEPGFFQKLVGKIQDMDALTRKYDSLADEIEKVGIELHRHENALVKLNEEGGKLYAANVAYYQSLEKYIVAGEMMVEELDSVHIPAFKQKADATGNPLDAQNYNKIQMARDMLESRVNDLRLAENVALQSMMMIQQDQQSNFMLARTIKSEFIVTIPIFKNGISQAIMRKKQALIAKDIDAVHRAAEKVMEQNAINFANQTTMIANMASRGAISVEKLQESYDKIMRGTQDAQAIIRDNMAKAKAEIPTLQEQKQKLLLGPGRN